MGFVVRGITLVLGDRRYWPFIARPLAVSALMYAVIVAIGWFLTVPLMQSQLARVGVGERFGAWGANLVFVAVLWFTSTILFVTIAGLTSSFLWDRLSYEVERTVSPNPPKAAITFRHWLLDTIPRVGFATLIFCLSTGCFWLLPVSVALASWLCLYDYSAAAYLRRGITFLPQFAMAPRVKGALTFSLSCGLLTLLPVVNVILLPGLVAGGTLMVAEGSRSSA